MAVREGYKQTEVGVIPEDWEGYKLVEITTSVSSGKSSTQSKAGKYPIYGSTGIIGKQAHFDYEGDKILVARVGANAGTVNTVTGKYCVSDNTLIISYQKSINIRFAYFQLVSMNLNSLVFGSGQPLITGGQLKELILPMPHMQAEQTAIANALSDVDALIQSLDALIAKKRLIKQGAMQTLLNPYDEQGQLKDGWVVKKLGEVGVFRGGSGFPIKHQGNVDGVYPFYKVSDMNNEGNAIFMVRSNNYIDEKIKKKIGVNILPSNTIVFAKVGAAIFLERKRILSKKSCIDNNMMGFIFDSEVYDTRYVHYLFITIQLGKLVSTTALPSLNGKDISVLAYSFPNKPEQSQIATILSDMDAEITALETKRSKVQTIKQGMMQNLLTGKIRLLDAQELAHARA